MASQSPRSSWLARATCLAALALVALPAGSALAAPSEEDPPPAPPAPQLTINPGSYDFGIVELDRGDSQTNFNVHNAGLDWVSLSTQITGPDASAFWFSWDGCGGGNLSPGSNCGVDVRFNPNEPREYHATLRVSAGGVDFTAELTGTGGLREVTATPNPVDFGTIKVGESSTRSVTLRNTGNLFFQSVVAIPIGGDVGAFRLLEDNCSMQPLAPTLSCQMKVRFTPYEADNAEATLALIGDGNPTLITLRGVGVDGPKADSGAAAAAGKAKSVRSKKAARVAFNWRRGLPAPYKGNRVDLGVARCVGAPTCRVSVRAWLVTRGGGGAAGTRTTSVRRSTWWVGNGSPVSLWVPRDLGGSGARLVVDLSTKAAGRPVGVQRLNVRLLEGVRRGGAVVATLKKAR